MSNQSELSTTFAVGEEAETKVTPTNEGEVSPLTGAAESGASRQFGGEIRYVWMSSCRTKKIGHFFPGGTVDAYDTWLELKGTDEKGRTIFWSGMVEDGRQRPGRKGSAFLSLAAA